MRVPAVKQKRIAAEDVLLLCVCVCVCVCVFIKFHITAQSGPVILVILDATRIDPPKGGYVCVCVVIPYILDVGLVDAPAGVTEEEGDTGFLHLPSAVLALVFIARKFSHPFPLSTVKSNFVYN